MIRFRLPVLLATMLTACMPGVHPGPDGSPRNAARNATPDSSPQDATPDGSTPDGSHAQSRGCTEIGCTDGLVIDFKPSASWPSGSYVIEVTADGESTVCEITLPLRACGAEGSARCSGKLGASLGESGCALPPDQHGISGVAIHGQYPAQIALQVTRNGQEMLSKSLTPTYETLRPNGPECEPTCQSASLSVPVGTSFHP